MKTHEEQRLHEHLRRTLTEVANVAPDTTPEFPVSPTPQTGVTHPRRPRIPRPIKVAASSGAAIAVAAFAWVNVGPEYVDQLPSDDEALIHGKDYGTEWWVVPSFHEDSCHNTLPGVEFVPAANNLIGREWNTVVLSYGEALDASTGCIQVDEKAWLDDPSKSAVAISHGDGYFAVVGMVHPDVTELRVSVDGEVLPPVETVPSRDEVDAPRVGAALIPADADSVVVDLADSNGNVVPGAQETFDLANG